MKYGKKFLVVTVVLALMLSIAGMATAQDNVSGDLEIFSWWTGGGEAKGLEALIAKFKELHPNVNIINSAVAGGSGVNAKAVLTTRMLGGDPPDTFQVHAGAELNSLWVKAGRMEPLNDLYKANGWMDQFPKGLLDLISDKEGNIYSVPVNIHRSNVMWFVPSKLTEWGVTVPKDWDEFVNTTCPALQAKKTRGGVRPARAPTLPAVHSRRTTKCRARVCMRKHRPVFCERDGERATPPLASAEQSSRYVSNRRQSLSQDRCRYRNGWNMWARRRPARSPSSLGPQIRQ